MPPEAPYTVREIDQLFKAADQRADEFHSRLMDRMDNFENNTTKTLERIELQTRKTNGRVSKLERYMLVVGTAVAVLIMLKFPEMKALIGLI